MFLAIKEMLKEKARFLLIIFVIALISYLVYFLMGLAYGLATSYTNGIDQWSASGVYIQDGANRIASRSKINESSVADISAHQKASLGLASLTVREKNKSDAKIDATVFGVQSDSFLLPNVIKGEQSIGQGRAVVDKSFQDSGYVIGDKLRGVNTEQDLVIVGFADKTTYQTSPIIYVELTDWRKVLEDSMGGQLTGPRYINAVVVREPLPLEGSDKDNLEYITIKDFNYALPGYSAQVLTFGLMIGFLILIASLVLGIFVYILTIQKKSIFGVLKAQGISNAMMAQSVVLQTLLITIIGIGSGLALTILSAITFARSIPFSIQPLFYLLISLTFIICAILGALFSVRAVNKIDPIKAIG